MGKMTISDLLSNMGMDYKLVGFAYSVDAIRMAAKEPEILEAARSTTWPVIAERYGVTPNSVYKAIRSALMIMYSNTPPEQINQYVIIPADKERGYPKPISFLAALAWYVRDHPDSVDAET